MVSNASDDLPEPDSPVITTSWSRGSSTSMSLRLCSRAPRTKIRSDGTSHSPQSLRSALSMLVGQMRLMRPTLQLQRSPMLSAYWPIRNKLPHAPTGRPCFLYSDHGNPHDDQLRSVSSDCDGTASRNDGALRLGRGGVRRSEANRHLRRLCADLPRLLCNAAGQSANHRW